MVDGEVPLSHGEDDAVLSLRDLSVALAGGPRLVEGIDITISRGELFCLVGESGAGKTLTALALMHLLPAGATRHATTMRLEGCDLLTLDESACVRLRGNRMAMVFQEPMTSLNPVMSVGDQVIEALRAHRALRRAEARAAALAMFERLRMPAPATRLAAYPHQLSGGQRQRAMIAMALICRPALLIADEPTTALDVTIEADILGLIDELRRDLGTAILLITHNIALVAESADRIAVMHAGRIIEIGPRRAVIDDPMHPYTIFLLAALPGPTDAHRPLTTIPPARDMADRPSGCRFAPRCPAAIDRCNSERPDLNEVGPGHFVACWRAPIEAVAR